MMYPKPTGLLFLLLCAFSSQADVHLNNGGTGEVLVFPLYTVANGHNTLVSVSNTTHDYKAVKIRFRESINARNVLIFNIYLNPLDTWSAALALGGDVPVLISNTADKSCAPFLANTQPFLPFEVQQFEANASLQDIQLRMQTGIVEVYDMGQMTDLGALVNADGLICDSLQDIWLPGGIWDNDATDLITPPNGGLKAELVILDVANGYSFSQPATVFEDFYPDNVIPHTQPGDVEPNLSSADNTSVVLHDGQAIRTQWPTGFEAVSANILSSSVANDYIIDGGILAFPEIVYTLPTKTFYTENQSIAPFNMAFDNNSQSHCMLVDSNPLIYDQEGKSENSLVPPPPPQPRLCRSLNFATLSAEVSGNFQDSILSTFQSEVFQAGGITSGTFRINMEGFVTERGVDPDTQTRHRYYGLPVIGFTFQRYINSNAQPGILATYSSHLDQIKWQRIENITP